MTKKIFLLLSITYTIFLLWGNQNFYLWDQDEAAYAGFARQMLASGNWVMPDFLWSEPHRKTPFHFWTIAFSFSIFGENEFALRLPSVAFWIGTLSIVFFYIKKIFLSEKTAIFSVAILASSLMLPNFAKIALTDSALVFFQTLCALSLFSFLKNKDKKQVVILWLSMAFGILVKGPAIVIMIGLLMFLVLIFHPKRWLIFKTYPWFGLPLALLPLLVWGRLAWQQDNGKFITWLIDWYVLKRASGEVVFDQTGPIGYYLVFFIVSFLPFILFFPKAISSVFLNIYYRIKKTFKTQNTDLEKENLFDFEAIKRLELSVWAISGWLIYEFIPSKLPSYAFGAMPALAILMALLILEKKEYEKSKKYIGWTLQILLPTLLFGGLLWFSQESELLLKVSKLSPAFAERVKTPAVIFLPILLIINFLSIYFWKKNQIKKGVLFSFLTGFIFLNFVWQAFGAFNQERSICYKTAQIIAKEPQRKVIFSTHFGLPSLPFYIGKTNAYQYEKGIDNQKLAAQLQQPKPVFILIKKEHQELYQILKPFIKNETEISGFISDRGKNATWILVSN